MEKTFSVVGPDSVMDRRGKLFSKVAGHIREVKNQRTAAEERFVAKKLKEGVKLT